MGGRVVVAGEGSGGDDRLCLNLGRDTYTGPSWCTRHSQVLLVADKRHEDEIRIISHNGCMSAAKGETTSRNGEVLYWMRQGGASHKS